MPCAWFCYRTDWTESAALPGGCLMLAAAVEFDDQPGPVRDRVAALQREWMDSLARTVRGAIEEGHASPVSQWSRWPRSLC